MAKYKNVTLVLLITFLYHTMNQMFTPVLPVYITELGGNKALVGAIVGLLSLGAVGGKVYFGRVATQSSNQLVLRIGLVVATVALFLYIPLWGFAFLALARFFQSIGLAGYVAGGQGLLAESTNPQNRGLFFGIFSAMIGIGMMVGPLFGTYLAESFGYPVFFIGAAVVVGIAALLSLAIDSKNGNFQLGMGKDYRPHSPWKNRRLLVVCGAMFFAATTMGATLAMITLHAHAVGIAHATSYFILFSLLFTLGGLLAGFLTDRLGSQAVVVPGFVFMIVGVASLMALKSMAILVFAGFFVGLGLGFVNTALISMVPGYSKNEVDATNDLAFFSNAFDLGIVLGSMGLSWIATHSFAFFWLAVAVLTSLGLLVYIRYNPEKTPSPAQAS